MAHARRQVGFGVVRGVVGTCAMMGTVAAQPLDGGVFPLSLGAPGGTDDHGHGGDGAASGATCISPSDLERALRMIAESGLSSWTPGTGAAEGPESVPAYRFFPQAGNVDQDLVFSNYVDLDTSGGILDWRCGSATYNGHGGHDVVIRSFAEQAIGVPIYAVLPGTVVARDDGNFDQNTNTSNPNANFVIVDHGGGLQTWYWHMKNGSVAVNVGDAVVAGQQLGLTASSGYSTWPHLHFETRLNGNVVEPFAGACRVGENWWTPVLTPTTAVKAVEFAFSPVSLNGYALPFDMPRTGQAASNTNYFWMMGTSLPPNVAYRVRYYRPNGTVALDWSGTYSNFAYSHFTLWQQWNVPNLTTTIGDWRMVFELGGREVINAILTVSPGGYSPTFNRPPNAAGLAFDPPVPSAGDVVFCRVQGSAINDDPDFDILRYTYAWTVNGAAVRTVTTAAMSDALPSSALAAGDLVRCTVTISDGEVSIAPVSVQVNVTGGCPADLSGDGFVDDTDFVLFTQQYEVFACDDPAMPANCSADLSADGFVDDVDFVLFTQGYEGFVCP